MNAMTALLLGALSTSGATPFHTPTNAIKQTAVAKTPDTTLKERIEYRLDIDTVVRKYDIKVAVNNGVATLTGTVATAAQKAQAARVARVAGISRVDNLMTVDRTVDETLTEKAEAGLSKTGEAITDAWITAKVRFHFLGDDALKGSSIDVETHARAVTLKGTVKTAAARRRAVALATNTEGCTRVLDQLTVGMIK